jgi:hypothetical protein
VAESLATTTYAIPIALTNPYIALGLAVDYIARGRSHFIPKDHTELSPGTLAALGHLVPPSPEQPEPALTVSLPPTQNPESAGSQAPGASESSSTEAGFTTATNTRLQKSKVSHE